MMNKKIAYLSASTFLLMIAVAVPEQAHSRYGATESSPRSSPSSRTDENNDDDEDPVVRRQGSSVTRRRGSGSRRELSPHRRDLKRVTAQLRATSASRESAEADIRRITSELAPGASRPTRLSNYTRNCNSCREEVRQCNTGVEPAETPVSSAGPIPCVRDLDTCVENYASQSCVAIARTAPCLDSLGEKAGRVLQCWRAFLESEKRRLAKDIEEFKELEGSLDARGKEIEELITEEDEGDCVDGDCRDGGGGSGDVASTAIEAQRDIQLAMINREPTTLDYITGLAPAALGIVGMGLNAAVQFRGMDLSAGLNRTAMGYQRDSTMAAIAAYQANYPQYVEGANAAGQSIIAPQPFGGMFGSNFGTMYNPNMYNYMGAGYNNLMNGNILGGGGVMGGGLGIYGSSGSSGYNPLGGLLGGGIYIGGGGGNPYGGGGGPYGTIIG